MIFFYFLATFLALFFGEAEEAVACSCSLCLLAPESLVAEAEAAAAFEAGFGVDEAAAGVALVEFFFGFCSAS